MEMAQTKTCGIGERMMKDERIQELVADKFDLIIKVRGCLNIKKDDVEGLIKQALAEQTDELLRAAREKSSLNVYNWLERYWEVNDE